VGTVRKVLKWVLPFVVSAGILAFLLSRIETRGLLGRMTFDVAVVLVPAMLAYAGLTLWIEATSLVRLVPISRDVFGLWTAARVKAASYLIYIINYALGAGSLTLLLRRRAGLALSEAGGIVMLVALFDLGFLLLIATLGAALYGTEAATLRAGVIAGAGIGLVGGFVVLRTPRPLGPLERLRSMALFRAARTSSLGLLIELAMLRLLFVLSFLSVAWATLMAFDIRVPIGDVVVNIAIVALISTLPIAVAGLGTGQAAFVFMFRQWGDQETLLACSLAFSAGLILTRAGIGFACSQEFVREALAAARETDT
jgi:hypothetical protein